MKTPMRAPRKGIGIKIAPSKAPTTGIQLFLPKLPWLAEAVITKPLKMATSHNIANQSIQGHTNQLQAMFKQMMPKMVKVLDEKN